MTETGQVVRDSVIDILKRHPTNKAGRGPEKI